MNFSFGSGGGSEEPPPNVSLITSVLCQKAHTKLSFTHPLGGRPGWMVAGGTVGSGAIVGGIVTPVGPPPTFDGTVDTGGSTVVMGPVGVGSGVAVGDGPNDVGVTPEPTVVGGIVGEAGGSSHFPPLSTLGGSQGVVVDGTVVPGTVVPGTVVPGTVVLGTVVLGGTSGGGIFGNGVSRTGWNPHESRYIRTEPSGKVNFRTRPASAA